MHYQVYGVTMNLPFHCLLLSLSAWFDRSSWDCCKETQW